MTETTEMVDTNVVYIPLVNIRVSETNQRKSFPKKEIEELADSINKQGLINPITVRPCGDGIGFIVIAGERRFRAHQHLDREEIKATVLNCTEDEALELQLVENLHRKDIHPLEEASGFEDLLKKDNTIKQIANKLAKSEGYVAKRLNLLTLITPLKQDFKRDKITLAHALMLSRLTAEQQEKVSKLLYDWKGNAYNVQELDRKVQSLFFLELTKAKFDTDDAELLEDCPSCTKCMKRTGFNKSLFDDIKTKETCTDPDCYKMKLAAHIRKALAKSEAEGQKLLKVVFGSKSGKKDVLDTFVQLEEKNLCKSAKKAIVIKTARYSNYPEVGEIIYVCADPECATHSTKLVEKKKANDESSWQEKQAEARLEAAVESKTALTLAQSVSNMITKLKPEVLYEDLIKILAKTMNWQVIEVLEFQGTKANYQNVEKVVAEKLASMKEVDKLRFLYWIIYYKSGLEKGSRLMKDATDAGVDIKGLKKQIRKELEEQAKKEKEKKDKEKGDQK